MIIIIITIVLFYLTPICAFEKINVNVLKHKEGVLKYEGPNKSYYAHLLQYCIDIQLCNYAERAPAK